MIDEAEILGDRTAIMANGKVKCCGSSLYLKQQYGAGYTLVVSLKAGVSGYDMKDAVNAYILQIPGAQIVSIAGSEITYKLPFDQTGTFSKVFAELEDNKDKIKLNNYGISVTTLEEVFLKIGHDNMNDNIDDSSSNSDSNKSGDITTYKKKNNTQDERKELLLDNDSERYKIANSSQFQFHQSSFQLQDRSYLWIFLIHVYAILYKRWCWVKRDGKALVCQLICPTILSAVALALIQINIATNQDPLVLNTQQYYDNPIENDIPITVLAPGLPSNNIFYQDEAAFLDTYTNSMQSDVGQLYNVTIESVNNLNITNITTPYQFELWNNTKYAKWNIPYNGLYFDPFSNQVLLGINASGYHALPISLNIWNNWLIKTKYSSSASITITNHPLPVTSAEDNISEQITGFISSIYLILAFSFIPATAIYFGMYIDIYI